MLIKSEASGIILLIWDHQMFRPMNRNYKYEQRFEAFYLFHLLLLFNSNFRRRKKHPLAWNDTNYFIK